MRIPETARRSSAPSIHYTVRSSIALRLLCWSCLLLTLLALRWPPDSLAFGQKPSAPTKKSGGSLRPKQTEEEKAARRAEKVKAVELGKTNTEKHAKNEEEFYTLTPVSIPQDITLEVGGMTWLPKGELGISTRRGEIYVVEDPAAVEPNSPKFHRVASGLHEVLGLANRDGWLYATQRGEVTRLKDENDDRRADIFEVVADNWEITGDYHEYAVGSNFDREGNLYVALCLTGSFGSSAKYRGWCLKITPDGKTIPICSGIRSPGGIGMNAKGDMFYTDNQGPWNGTCSLKYLKPGGFQGHPAGNVWYKDAPQMGPAPAPPKDGSRIATEAARIPELVPS
ncbi:MAG: hypothetical protein SGJ20_22390, partial [Planctomycetota bacterium]|nr:hypothetical protein [Planctomycetota bacterium]